MAQTPLLKHIRKQYPGPATLAQAELSPQTAG